MSNELIPQQEDVQMIEKLSKYAVDSKFFDKLGGMGGMMSIMLYAKEIGIPPMSALFGGMHNVMGKIEISPQMMNALIRKAGHRIDVVEHTATRCRLKGTRKGTDENIVVSYSIEDAKRALIYKPGGGWEKYPEDMLFARCISRLGRRLFPDVIGTMYVDGEISESASEDNAPTVDIEPIQEQLPAISIETATESIKACIGEHKDIDKVKTYIEYVVTKLDAPLAEALVKWKEKPEVFVTCFNKWLEKQIDTKKEQTI